MEEIPAQTGDGFVENVAVGLELIEIVLEVEELHPPLETETETVLVPKLDQLTECGPTPVAVGDCTGSSNT